MGLLALWMCLPPLPVVAGGDVDPVLMRVGGKDVTRSEFEYYYNRAVRRADAGISPKAYSRSFTDFKLKVQAAEAAGLDTLPAFRREMAAYRARLSVGWLTDSAALERALRRCYGRWAAGGGAVRVEQVWRRLPQHVTGEALRAASRQMDSIYDALCQAGPGHFTEFVKRFSDDDSVRWVRRLEETAEFEDTVFSVRPGSWSRPFFTPRGLHIVRVVERAPVPAFEAVRDSLLRANPRLVAEAARVWADRRKEAYGYASRRLTDGQVRRILAVLAVCLCAGLVAAGGAAGVCMIGAAILVLWQYKCVAQKQFGGISGDLAGWFLQKAEIWMLAAFVACRIVEAGV